VRLRPGPAQLPRRDCEGKDGKRPFLERPAARLNECECQARCKYECRQRASRANGNDRQLVPDPISGRCEGHEGRDLTRAQAEEQRVLDVEVVWDFVCVRHDRHDPNAACTVAMIWGAKNTPTRPSTLPIIPALPSSWPRGLPITCATSSWSALVMKPSAASAGAIFWPASVKSPIKVTTGVTSTGGDPLFRGCMSWLIVCRAPISHLWLLLLRHPAH